MSLLHARGDFRGGLSLPGQEGAPHLRGDWPAGRHLRPAGCKQVPHHRREPLLRTDLDQLIALLADIPSPTEAELDITLTTNGYLLAQQARKLREAGLRRITVSLDSLDDDVFKQMNGRGFGTERVLRGIEHASEVGLGPVKINAVVQKGVNDHTIVDLARHFKGTGHIVRFIEYMDVGNLNGWKWDQVVTADEIVDLIDREMPLEALEPNYTGEVANRYRYRNGGGEIGVIASVDQALLRQLHEGTPVHRREGIHLPVRIRGNQSAGPHAGRRR